MGTPTLYMNKYIIYQTLLKTTKRQRCNHFIKRNILVPKVDKAFYDSKSIPLSAISDRNALHGHSKFVVSNTLFQFSLVFAQLFHKLSFNCCLGVVSTYDTYLDPFYIQAYLRPFSASFSLATSLKQTHLFFCTFLIQQNCLFTVFNIYKE